MQLRTIKTFTCRRAPPTSLTRSCGATGSSAYTIPHPLLLLYLWRLYCTMFSVRFAVTPNTAGLSTCPPSNIPLQSTKLTIPPSMPSTSAHYQTPVPGPTTAQMIEGNVYNIIELFYSTTSSFGLKWCLECKLHLSTRTHTYTAKYVSQCNVSFFLQIFLVLDHKKVV